jgi:hypothetical protein
MKAGISCLAHGIVAARRFFDRLSVAFRDIQHRHHTINLVVARTRAMGRNGLSRKLAVEVLEQRRMLANQVWNLAADFAADFVNGLPQDNPNGAWTYLATDGTTSSLLPTSGPNPDTFGVGAGWAEANGVPSYARGGVFGFPSQTMAGHGPAQIIWTAPESVDLGGIELTGLLTQATFAPERQMQLRIYKNDSALPFVTTNADFQSPNTIVPLPATRVSIAPGETLTIEVDGLGPLGNSVSTFAAWNFVINEYQLPSDYNYNGSVDAADYIIWRKKLNTVGTPGMVVGDGTSTGDLHGTPDGVVDEWDYQFWAERFGQPLDTGIRQYEYHPAAIVVQTTGVTLPNGSQLDISNSATQGLQEALDYSALHGWDIFVLAGTYALDAHLDIEELQLRSFRFEDVTLNFSQNVTDFGIRFDSTMQVDWYWNGGALNAPAAQHGVLFAPRTPHPKDGPIYNTVGVVDSRFDFNVEIIAPGNRVTMDTTQAVVNDSTLHFQNLSTNEITFVGTGFTETNIFAAARTDDPIPFDLFTPTGRVTVLPPVNQYGIAGPGSFATIVLPDGSLLETGDSTTSGLQEAFDYAAAYDLDVLVFGRGVRNANPNTSFGHYTLSSTLTVGDLVARSYKIYGVTFLYPTVGGTAMTLGDLIDSDFELTGEVVGYASDVVLHIKPDTVGILNSFVRIQHPVGMTNNVAVNVLIDPSLQSIDHTEFYFHEVNEGQFGIRVDNPSSDTYFQDNFIRTVHAHATSEIAVQLGQHATNASNIRRNVLEIRTATALYPSHSALQIWGDYNAIDLIAVGATSTFGAKFEPGSNNNILFYGTLNASTPIANYGINNTFIPVGGGSGGELNVANLPADTETLAVMRPRAPAKATLESSMLLIDDVFDELLLTLWLGRPAALGTELLKDASFARQIHSEPHSQARDYVLSTAFIDSRANIAAWRT